MSTLSTRCVYYIASIKTCVLTLAEYVYVCDIKSIEYITCVYQYCAYIWNGRVIIL